MATIDTHTLAEQLYRAHLDGQAVEERPTATDKDFSLNEAYQVAHEIAQMVHKDGWRTAGRKVGYANRAGWPKDLDTIVWGYVYDKTVHNFESNNGTFSLQKTVAPKIEPEIVFKLKNSPAILNTSAAEVLESVEWYALGFEIVDNPYPNWHYRPADMVATWGFHAALLIGQPHPLGDLEDLARQLADFKLKLSKNGETVAEGTGRNVYDSPALSLAQLIRVIHDQSETNFAPLEPGEVITSGTVVTPPLLGPGEEWSAQVEGLDLPAFTVKFTE
jgi:2-keto-4-pentenoate hydratase